MTPHQLTTLSMMFTTEKIPAANLLVVLDLVNRLKKFNEQVREGSIKWCASSVDLGDFAFRKPKYTTREDHKVMVEDVVWVKTVQPQVLTQRIIRLLGPGWSFQPGDSTGNSQGTLTLIKRQNLRRVVYVL